MKGLELMAAQVTVGEPAKDVDLPKYSDCGHILCIVWSEGIPYEDGTPSRNRWNVEVLESGGCAFWIQEGKGFDYWLDDVDFPGPGVFVVEGIVGTYHRGDGYSTDDDVDWVLHSDPRPALWSDMPDAPPHGASESSVVTLEQMEQARKEIGDELPHSGL